MVKINKLIIISSSFPFGKQEIFLENEVSFLSNYFNITVIPSYYYNSDRSLRDIPNNVRYLDPYIKKNIIKNLFFLFNTGYFFIEFKELIRLLTNYKLKKSFFKEFLISVRNINFFCNSEGFTFIKNNPDSILYYYWANSSILASDSFKNKTFIRVHGGELNPYYSNGYVPFLKEKCFVKATYLPISNNAIIKLKSINSNINYVLSRLGTFSEMNQSNHYSSPLFVVSCSSVIQLKRVDLIVKILSKCKRDIHWVHFGDGPELHHVISLAKDILPKNISFDFVGRINNKDVLKFYELNNVHLFINMSETEGIPVSIMEDFSFGIPALVTDVGGTSELVNFENGFLIPNDIDYCVVSEIIENFCEEEFYSKSVKAFDTWMLLYNGSNNYLKLVDALLN